ncbi:MAG TPA: HEAT repeat domain-containing protein [Candidatus Binatia bacterium]|jgi:HEAT repeat protein|nr:HEAT repeat domain-containing protein [Candidatus Binatia bacterium]
MHRLLNPGFMVLLLILSGGPSLAESVSASQREQVDKLIGVLKSAAPEKEKADACRELARIGTSEAVAPLASLLGDEHVSHMARYGLETIPDPTVDSAFREALGKLRGRPLVGVIGSIGVRRDTKALKPLARLLQDTDPEVVQAAARALGSIGTPAAAKALLARAKSGFRPAGQVAFYEGIFRCAEMLAANGHRKMALEFYDLLRGAVVPQLRTAAWRGAVLLRKEAGVPVLLEALHSPDFSLFAAALRISQEMPGPEVTRALAAQLVKLPAENQIPLIQTLARRDDTTALPALFAAARKCVKPVRLEAIRALAQIGQPSAVPVLVELLGDADADLAQAAQEGLGALPGKEADGAVLALLEGSQPDRRITAMELIVRRRMKGAIPELFKAANASETNVRILAIKKVGELAGPGELPSLLDLLADARTPEDIEATEQALSAVGVRAANPGACAKTLGERVVDARPAQKCALVHVLAAIGGADARKLVRAEVDSPETEVHAAALRALGSWNSAEAAPDLLELARAANNSTDKLICLRSYLGLAGQPELTDEQRLAMCRQAAELVQKDEEKKLLLGTLSGVHSGEALELIKPYLEDAGVSREAKTATVDIAEKLLAGTDSTRQAPKLIEPLEKVAQGEAGDDLTKRAKALLEKARKKASAT